MRLACEIHTTMFLGTRAVAADLLKVLRALPTPFVPTKVRTSSSRVHKFSFDTPAGLLELLPGDHLYEGNVSLRKVGGRFELFVFWCKGNREWFETLSGKPFNTIGFSSGRWDDALSEKWLPCLQSIFISLCETFGATYGSMRLEDASQGASPDGYGICLPRLHWTTFLGSAYSAALRDRLAIPCDAFVITRTSNGVLIRLRCSPQEAIQRAAVEARAIEHLGADYFWDTRDDWRKPRRRYRMPELDWSSVLTDS